MIADGNDNKTITVKYRCNCCHCMPMLSLLGGNHCLPLFHMSKRFICLNGGKRINQFTIVYMINPNFYVNKSFREQVEHCMKTIFGEITQTFIRATLLKKEINSFGIINVL